jgi:ABC-type phosphate transport system, auxiliary component
MKGLQQWIQSGVPYIWLNAGAVSVCLIMVMGLILLIASRGLGHFWPAQVIEFQYLDQDGASHKVIGEIAGEETVPAPENYKNADGSQSARYLKTPN